MDTLVPKLFTTLKGYSRGQLVTDLSAGVIVGIVALPLAIAFAIASGVSPERGLFTAIVAGFVISTLGGSRVQIGGPTGAFVVIVYAIVQRHGVEGLAMAAFGLMEKFSNEPLLKTMTQYIMRDESRHVAFGVLSLEGVYKDFNEREMREREEFTYEGCRLMRDRLYAVEVWQEMGLPIAETHDIVMKSEIMREFQKMLFSKVVPNCKRLGLLTPWLRERFHELDILKFEHEEASI